MRRRIGQLSALALLVVAVCLAAAAVAAASTPAGSSALLINADTPIYIEEGMVTPLQLALRDVQIDFYKVLGKRPVLLSSLGHVTAFAKATRRRPGHGGAAAAPSSGKPLVVAFGGSAVARVFAAASPSVRDPLPGPESFRLVVVDSLSHATFLCVYGQDVRGDVFSFYAFSELILGVEPLYWWADLSPVFAAHGIGVPRRTNTDPWTSAVRLGTPLSAAVAAAAAAAASYSSAASGDVTLYDSGVPAFRWRGWFPNDEDLLGGFRHDPMGESVFGMETWDRVYEALLRMRGNAAIPGTTVYADSRCLSLAARRGVVVSSQHFTPIFVNTWRWPLGVPYSFDKNPEMQDHAQQASVAAMRADPGGAGREALYLIGYRGLNDYAFWRDEPSFNTTEKRCALINRALARQYSIATQSGSGSRGVVTFLWDEMTDLFLSGHLRIPAGTTRVFCDAGDGVVDAQALKLLRPGDGLYYHVMMESGDKNQLTEMVPLATFYRQVGRFVRAGATAYFMLNVSDLRPVVQSVDAIMRFLWAPSAKLALSPTAAQEQTLHRWAVRFLGADVGLAGRVAEVYGGFYNVTYIADDTARHGEQQLSTLLRVVVSAFRADLAAGRPVNTTRATAALRFADRPLAQLRALYPRTIALRADVVAERRPFFDASVAAQQATHLALLEALVRACAAVEEWARGSHAAAVASARAGAEAFELLFEAQRCSEATAPRWRGLFSFDTLDMNTEAQCEMLGMAASMEEEADVEGGKEDAGSGLTAAAAAAVAPPPCNRFRFGTGKWSPWFAFQEKAAANFPLFYHSPGWTWSGVVRVLCDDASCQNTPVGGTFGSRGDTSLNMTVPAPGAVIHYTLDGTAPTAASPVFAAGKPVRLEVSTVVQARAFVEGKPLPLTTKPHFTRTPP